MCTLHIVDTNGFIGRNVTRSIITIFSTILEKNVHKIHWLNTFNFTFDAFNKSQNVNTNNKLDAALCTVNTKHKTSKELKAEKICSSSVADRHMLLHCIKSRSLLFGYSILTLNVLLKCKFHMAIALIFFVSFSS